MFASPLILGVLTGIVLNFVMTAADATYPKFLVLMFDLVGNPMTPIGLLILGIFIYTQIANRKERARVVVETSTRVHVAMQIIIQLLRHLVMPIILILLCKALKISDEKIVEVSVCLYAAPTAVMSFSICYEYGFGAVDAFIDCAFGTITYTFVIPVLQIITRKLYRL